MLNRILDLIRCVFHTQLALRRLDMCAHCGQRVYYWDNAINGEPLPPLKRLTSEWAAIAKTGRCPDCREGTLVEGPHGGLSVNFTCNRCGQLYCDMGPFGIERIVQT